ncbi:MAG: hypothetical protein L6E13_08260 [Firmicutes bacterium]|nr:hypothetical protein [Bacillota bacterium]
MQEPLGAALAILAEASDARPYRLHPDRPLEGWAIQSGHQVWLWASGLRPLQPDTAGEVVTYAVWGATPGGATYFLGSAGTGAGGLIQVTVPLPEAAPLAALLVTAQRAQTHLPAAVVLAGRLYPAARPGAASAFAPAGPAPTGAQAPEPGPDLPPEPTVEPAPEPTVGLAPEPTREQPPETAPAPAPAPTGQPAPEPTSGPPPGATPELAPEPVAGPASSGAEAPEAVRQDAGPGAGPAGATDPEATALAPAMAGGGDPVQLPEGSAPAAVLQPDQPADPPRGPSDGAARPPHTAGARPASATPPAIAAGAAPPAAPASPADPAPPQAPRATPDPPAPEVSPALEPGAPEPVPPPGCVPLTQFSLELEPTGRGVLGGLTGAGGTAHLDFVRGSLLLTLRGLPRPEQLGRAAHTGRPYNTYRVWLQTSGSRAVAPLGMATRVWGETYRLQVRTGLALRRFDTLLVTAEDRAGSGARPSGPVVMAGRYRWYRAGG